MHPVLRLHLRTLLLAWLGAVSLSSHAALGGDTSSLSREQSALGAAAPAETLPWGTRYTFSTGEGVVVRQYASSAGRLVAVAWEGPTLPDMETLLGAYFADYAAAQRQKSRGLRLQRSDLVIESGGMMRAFRGRAYLPGQLPAGLGTGDIR